MKTLKRDTYVEFWARRVKEWGTNVARVSSPSYHFQQLRTVALGTTQSLEMLSPSVWAGEGQSCLVEMERAPPELDCIFMLTLPHLATSSELWQGPTEYTFPPEGAWSPG